MFAIFFTLVHDFMWVSQDVALFIFQTCYVQCVNVLKDYFSVWTSRVSYINPQRNTNPNGQINKAVFLRQCRPAIPIENQQRVNFKKERLKSKINASPILLQPFLFYRTNYSFAATSMCKIGAKDCFWKKYLLSFLCSLAK